MASLIDFMKSQMDVSKFEYSVELQNISTIPAAGADPEINIVSGTVSGLSGQATTTPQHFSTNTFYDHTYSGIISGTWANLSDPANYAVEVYIITDAPYLQDTCELQPDGTWTTSKSIGIGIKEILLVNVTTGETIESPYPIYRDFKARFYVITDTEYLSQEVALYAISDTQAWFYSNKIHNGIIVAKIVEYISEAGDTQYRVVGITSNQTNINAGRLPSSYLIPANDPSYDRDGNAALGKYGYMLNSRSWLYDIGLALLSFTTSGDYDLCREILNRLSAEQNTDGSFNFSFDNYIGTLFEGYVRTGAIGWVVWGASYYTQTTGDQSFVSLITLAGQWLLDQIVTDSSDQRYGLMLGGHGEYADDYTYSDTDIQWCSTEHQVSGSLGLYGALLVTQDQRYQRALNLVHQRVANVLFDSTNHRFYQGMTVAGIDSAWALDCCTWTGLSFISDTTAEIDVAELAATARTNFLVSDVGIVLSSDNEHYNETYSGGVYSGFKPYSDRDGGYSGSPNLVWSEGTLGYAALCQRLGETAEFDNYVSQISQLANITNGTGGVLYVTETFASLPWEFHAWESLTGTAWLYLLENNPNVLFPSINYSSSIANARFFEQLKKVEDAANRYAETVGAPNDSLSYICQFYRQFGYASLEWVPIEGALDGAWLLEVNNLLGISSDSDFEVLQDSATGYLMDFPHLAAVLGALVAANVSTFDSGIQDLAGWCGDLITSIKDSHNEQESYASFTDSLVAHVGKSDSFGPEDLIADVDALNLYSNYKNASNVSFVDLMTAYYNDGSNKVRYNSFWNNRFDSDYASALDTVVNLLTDRDTLELGVVYAAAWTALLHQNYTYNGSEANEASKVFVDLIKSRA